MVPSAAVSEHARYRRQLGRLGADEFVDTVVRVAAVRGWVEPGTAGRRVFGRFEPGATPWATLLYRFGRIHVRVDAFDDGSPLRFTRVEDDGVLTGLGAVLRAHPDADIVRYRPGRRCVLRIGERYVKFLPPELGARLDDAGRQLWKARAAGHVPFRVAEPDRWDGEQGALWQGVVAGEPIAPALAAVRGRCHRRTRRRGDGGARHRAGQSLAAVVRGAAVGPHRARRDPGAPPGSRAGRRTVRPARPPSPSPRALRGPPARAGPRCRQPRSVARRRVDAGTGRFRSVLLERPRARRRRVPGPARLRCLASWVAQRSRGRAARRTPPGRLRPRCPSVLPPTGWTSGCARWPAPRWPCDPTATNAPRATCRSSAGLLRAAERVSRRG